MKSEEKQNQLARAAADIFGSENDEFTTTARTIVREGRVVGMVVTVLNESYARTESEIDRILADYAAGRDTPRLRAMTAFLCGNDPEAEDIRE